MFISFYLTNRLEFLIDKLQSKKRKTIKISELKSKIKTSKISDVKLFEQNKNNNNNNNNSIQEDQIMDTSSSRESIQGVKKESKSTENEQQTQHPAYKQILENDNNDKLDGSLQGCVKVSRKPSGKLVSSINNIKTNSLVTCPSLIYVVLLLSLTNILRVPASELNVEPKQAPAETDIKSLENEASVTNNSFRDSRFAQSLALNLKVLFDGFLGQYANRDRWIRIPEPSNTLTRLPKRPTANSNSNNNDRLSQRNPFTRAIERISNRIGSRNTIRVHNAFRDLAWRLMSSLSMPTPVIYELRRQNFYSPEDDLRNDSLFNKNTTKTIRSRSLLSRELKSINQLGTVNSKAQQRSNDDDDGEDDSNLESRLRSRLEYLISRSRRNLFGRVIRMPSLFPFKRQEEISSTGEKTATQNSSSVTSLKKGDSSSKTTSTTRRPSAWKILRRRKGKKKDRHDRQMISINGKQYYINDDGELKDWNDQSDDT